jgi:type IV pilus assembly protein PilQ
MLSPMTHTMKRTGRQLLCLLMLTGPMVASASATRALQSLDYVALDGDRVQITLTLSEAAPDPAVFTIDQPARLSLDLPDTRLAVRERVRRINVGPTRSVALAEAQGRTRMVVELSESVPHIVSVDGNRVIVEINPRRVAATRPSEASTQPPQIRRVDFRRGEQGEGRVMIDLLDASAPVDVREESGKVIARFRDTRAPRELIRRLDVVDFATPVQFVDLRSDGPHTELVLTPITGAEYEQVAYQTGNVFTLELQPLTRERLEERRREAPIYEGERISLSFQSVEVRALLQIIADVAGVNMVVSDAVGGQMTMRLQNVPWDQALEIILRQRGLGKEQQGNVILVAPNDEIARRAQEAQSARRAQQELSPLRTEIIQVNYSSAADIARLIREASERRGEGERARGSSGLLSERGQITVDERTNTLIVQEARENLEDIRRLIARLDVAVRQVLIESRIAVVNDDYAKEVGVRAGLTTISQSGGTTIGTSGTAAGADQVVQGTLPALADRFGVTLPINNPAGRFGLAVLGSDFLVDLELSAMQMEGRGELISTPRVVTADRREASIKQGFEVPYVTPASGNSPATVSFKEALLNLTVTPAITPDNRVFLNLRVAKDEPDFTRAVQGNPPLNRREINTEVLVGNGETLVLGGAFESTIAESATKVPLLGDLPLLGALFRSRADSTSRRELLVFVTPKILTEGLNINR